MSANADFDLPSGPVCLFPRRSITRRIGDRENSAETHDAKPECQSITDIIGNNTPDDEGDDWASASESMFPCAEPGYENIERIDLLDRLHEGLKQHLVDVAKLHSQGFSSRSQKSSEPPRHNSIPLGNVPPTRPRNRLTNNVKNYQHTNPLSAENLRNN